MSNVCDFAIKEVLQEEGGFVNNPRDPGGATNMGITLNELSIWRNVTCTEDDVRNLTEEEATKIYKTLYWDKIHGDAIKPPIALILFDAAVNHGVGSAIKLAQRAMRITDDAVFGPQTLKSINIVDPFDFMADFMTERAIYYVGLKQFDTFGRGWFHRLFKLTMDTSNFVQMH